MEITSNTRIIDLTVGQLIDIIAKAQAPAVEQVPEQTKRLVYGISGIAQLFNCSMTTANRIKACGRIDKAISQHGRIIVVDAEKALVLFNNK